MKLKLCAATFHAIVAGGLTDPLIDPMIWIGFAELIKWALLIGFLIWCETCCCVHPKKNSHSSHFLFFFPETPDFVGCGDAISTSLLARYPPYAGVFSTNQQEPCGRIIELETPSRLAGC